MENPALRIEDAELATVLDADLLELLVEKLPSLGRAPGAYMKPVFVALHDECALEERLSARHEIPGARGK